MVSPPALNPFSNQFAFPNKPALIPIEI